jgi:Phosphotransferase enzyme family
VSRVRACGATLFKRYMSNDAAGIAVARADWLRGRGVLTPGGLLARHGRLAGFELVAGQPGHVAVDGAAYSIEPALFSPIVRIHALVPALPLPRFDPLAKILPRLDTKAAALLQREVAASLEVIDGFELSRSVLHGDLHPGQLIFDEAGDAWLLDLDDLSEGDPAADIGNFAAHLATREEAGKSRPRASLAVWLEAVLAAYRQAGGEARPSLAEAYGRLALIRRALKFRERGSLGLLTALCADTNG